MKKRSRLSRALSILLAMLMILSNSAITTYADIIGGVSQQSAGSLEVEVQVTTDGTTIDTSHSGSIYMYLQGDNNHRILKKVDISNGVGSVSADQLYDQNGQNPSPVNPNADYTITFFEYTGNSQLQENQNYEHVQQHEKKKVGIGDYTLGDCKLITIPSSVRSGTKATVVMKAMGTTEASYSAIDSDLGVANDFGAFVKTLSIGADVEATLAANTVVSLGHSYNFSDNNYKAVNNKIIITKTFTDKDGKPKANASVTLKLYRDKELVGTQTVTTGSDGKATAEFQHLLYGNYTFYEVINNEEIKVDGKTEEGINVTYTGNAGIIIENKGFSSYSYFNNVEVSGSDLNYARGGFVVLDNAYEAHKNDDMTNAKIEKAGENEFPQIDFDTYFSTTLPNASKSIAAMKSSSDAQVYYVKASELKHDMDISSNGNKYIIMNVDMSDVGSAFTLPGQYKIDGTAIQANFENQKESQILWNFYDYNTDKVYEGTITQGSKMTGIILAPKCTVNGAPGNLGGTVIADTYNHTTGEIHGVRPYVESQIKNAAVKNSEKETKEAVANIYVKKTFADGDATQKFNFVLTTKNNAPVPANGTKLSISQSDGIKSFGEIKYTQAGTYTYTITEKNDGAAGVTYDGNTWTVTVNVPEDFSTPTVTYVKDKNTTNTTGAEFVNTYTEQKGNLSIKKVAGANTNLEGKTFYFKITGPDNYSEVKELVYGNGKDSITISDLKPGDYTVTEVTDSKGTTEVKGNQSFPYQVSGDGKITVKAGQTPEISVTNTSVLGKIKVTKKVIGKENSKDKFYVALFKADKETKVDNQPVKEITAGQSVTFENLVPGTYYVFETDEDGNKLKDTVVNGYIIPKDGTETTIINDQKSTVPEVGVTLTNKWLETSLSLVGGKTLTNITEDQAQKANFTFSVYKKGTNSNPVATGSYKAGKIEFTSISYNLKDLGGSSEKVFEYEIKEDIPSDAVNGVKNQIHYDTKIIPAAVTVALSSEELKITKVEVNGKEITSSSGIYDFSSVVAFENYIANGTDAVVSVIKRINNGYVISCDKKFRFTLNKADNETNSGYTDPQFNTPFTSSSVEITGAGIVEFAKIYFNKVGDYRYTLTEDNLAATGYEGYQKDSSIYNVTIHVEGINNKQLTATVFYQKNGEDSYEAEFNNTYTDTEAEIEFTAKKVLPERNLKDKEFKFEVKDADGKVVSEGSNDVTGKITFNKKLQITLGQMQGGEEKGNIITKDFTYTVSEKDGKDTAIKYDTPKSITVHASYDKFTGKLSLSLDDDAKDVIFTNHYDTKAEIAFTAKKVLPERNLKDKEFKFEIKDAAGKVVSEGSNDATGKITFNKKLQITLSQMQGGNEEGNVVTKDFTYTVSEKEGNDTAIDYDLSEKSITVHASYNKTTGELTLSLDNNAKSITFTNHYDTSASIGFNATKKLTGRKLADGEFTFTLAREDGTQEVTAVNDADGNIRFKNDAIRVTLADMQDADGGYAAEKIFTYLLTEQTGAEGSGLTYDTTPKTVKVKATYDKTTGELALALDKDSQNITITNKYTDSDSVALNGVKYLEGRSLKNGEFTFTVTDKAGNEVTTGTNNAVGQITFRDNLKYDLDDLSDGNGGYLKEKTYTYKVKENPGTEEAVTYDSTVKTVEVKVTHNAESGKVTAELTDKSEALIFKNSYDTSASIELNGTKNLTGRTQKAGEFHFEVKDSAGNLAATGTNDADGNINFDKAIQITLADMKDGEGYAESRDFIYTVTEVKGNAEGVTYDSEEKTVKIHAAYDLAEGKLTLSIADDSQPIKFTNSYDTKAEIGITANKVLPERSLEAGEFSFEIKDSAGTTVAEGSNDATGKITFNKKLQITLSQMKGGKKDGDIITKDFTYTVSEKEGNDTAIDYDLSEKSITVHASYNKTTGELTLSLDNNAKSITFTNHYDTSASIGFNATKKLTGRKLADGEFTFTLAREDGTQEVTAVNDADGNIRFKNDAIRVTLADMQDADGGYAAEKIFTYLLTEQTGAEGSGLTYDTTPKTVKVKATYDKTTGELALALDKDSQNITITNKYTDSDSVALNGVKYLEGRSLKNGEFTFTVTDKAGNEVTTGTNNAVGQITFRDNLKYDLDDLSDGNGGYLKEKTYTYKVKENPGTEEAVTYDSTVKTVEVKVTHNAESGKVTAELTDKSEALIFKNSYDTSASIELNGTKNLTGRTQKAGEFHFEVKDSAGNLAATGTNDADGNINFDKAIQITLADMKDGEGYAESRDFIYTVKEVTGKAEGVTYDSEEKTVKIHAAYDPAEGKLTLSLADDSQPIKFTNRYHAAGQLVINGIKYVNGEELNAAQKKVLAGNVEFKLERAEVTDGQTGEFKEIQTAALTEEGTFSFKTQNYTEKNAGKTYVYQISESKADAAGFDIDSTVYTYTVSVGDNGDGTLNITALDGDGKHVTSPITVTFNNEYHASGQAQLNGTKTLLGNRSGDIKEGEFTFQVLDEDGNEVTTGKTLAADETGKAQIAFEPISYTEKNAGKTYTYTVQEAAGEDKNITYDTTIYVVTVKVSDNLDGTLETEVTYPEGFENGLTFTNSYKASGAATLKTTKTLEGRTAALAANEFVFSLYEVAADGTRTPVLDKDENPMRAFNDAEGNVIFGEISYTQDDQGTHNYEIVEEAGNDSAVTYDKEPVKATVTVSDKDGSGVLNAEAVYEKDGHTSFRNEYHANGKITFTGLKKLTGNRAAEIKDGEFTFTVKDDATGETVATGKTKDGGVIEFTEISYTEKDKGEHTYTITENKGSDSSITYSEESVKVTVEVTDSNNGGLEATPTYPEGGVTFTNAYNAAGEVVLKASKTLEGSTLAADQFSFELKDEQGNVLQTKKNDADGKVTFDSLKYTEKDIDKTYTYTVSEVNNDITGVTYDNDVYTVKVQITDSKDSNGTLNITETSEKDGDVVEEITFANTFAGTVKLIKTSTEGRTLPGAEFALYAKNDKGEYDLYTADNEKGLYTTDAKGQINVENLPADDYYFIETAAPDGYKIRKADDGSDQKYSFKIGIEDGDAGIVENAKVNAELTVQNDINGTNSITVTKKITYIDPDTFDEFEMTWPKDQIFYVNLFTDPEGTIPYRTSTPKAFTVSENSSGTATFENVSKGTYYVFETDAEGNSIPMDEEMLDSNGKRYSATVDGDGTNQVELDVKTDAEEGKINLINRYFDMPGGAAYKGWINISKNILKGTDQIDVDDTFYAGIFTKTEDGEYDLYSVVTLANNDTVKTEVTLGGENGDQPITYYVYETDEQGNRIDQNEFAYTVTGEGEVSLDKSNTTADITITNTLSEQYSLLIRKVDENKDALVGAQFQITDGNGNVTDTWTSTLENHPVVLEPGTYKLSELVAPDGYKPGSEVTITVDDEGGISIESEVDGEADFDEDEDGILDYINYPETTITPTATPSAKTTPTGNQTTSRTSVKTGDDTPIALYILLLAVAACAAGGAVTVSRKKRKNK